MKSVRLTRKQEQILKYISQHDQEFGTSPTGADIAAHFGVTRATVSKHLDALERKKLIMRHRDRSGVLSIEIMDSDSPWRSGKQVPIIAAVERSGKVQFFSERDVHTISLLIPTQTPEDLVALIMLEDVPSLSIRAKDLLLLDSIMGQMRPGRILLQENTEQHEGILVRYEGLSVTDDEIVYRDTITPPELADFGLGSRMLLRPLVEESEGWHELKAFDARNREKRLRLKYSVNALFRWMTELEFQVNVDSDSYNFRMSTVDRSRKKRSIR